MFNLNFSYNRDKIENNLRSKIMLYFLMAIGIAYIIIRPIIILFSRNNKTKNPTKPLKMKVLYQKKQKNLLIEFFTKSIKLLNVQKEL